MGSAIAFAKNSVSPKDIRAIGIRQAEPGRRQELVKALPELLANRGRQLLHALEVIVERPFRDARGFYDGIHGEGLEWALGEKHRAGLHDLCPCPGTLLPSDLRPAR